MEYILSTEFAESYRKPISAVNKRCAMGFQGDVNGFIGVVKLKTETSHSNYCWAIPIHYKEHIESLEASAFGPVYWFHLKMYNIRIKRNQ